MEDGLNTNERLVEELETLRRRVKELESALARGQRSRNGRPLREVESERERLIAIMESTTDMVSTSTPDGWILYLNRAGKRLLGLPEDADVSVMRIRDIHPPRAAEVILNVGVPKAVEEGSYSHETFLVHRDGTEIPVSQVILSHKLPSGKVEYLSTIIRDIGDWKRAQEALKESEEKFRSVIQASPMGVHMYSLDAEGRLVFIGANPAADKMLGVDNQQFVGMTIEEAFPPLAETEIPARYRAAASRGEPWKTSQVNYEDEQIAGAYEVDAFQTSPGRMAVMFLDITDRLRAEVALRESEQRHRELFESMAQGVVYQNRDGHIIAANPAAERILGVTLDQMMGRTSMDPRWRTVREDGTNFPGPEHPSMVSLRTGKVTNDVMGVFHPKDEDYHWIEVFATPQFREGESEPHQVFATFTDITERRNEEQKRTELEQQLQHAQKMEAVGQLAGGIAHDFNNLLTTIAGYSELIAEDAETDGQLSADIEEIRKAADRASALTQQLLAFSRKQIISPKVLDMNTCIEESHKMLGRLIGENIDLRLELSSETCFAEADPSQLDQILVNLAVNARDAMPDGGRLVISTERATLDEEFCHALPDVEPGDFIMVNVSDSGFGMNEDTLNRIFEPFFTTKEYGKGTGLGLATVYGIVKQNCGAIKVSSQPGAGTNVIIFLPRVTRKGKAVAEKHRPVDIKGTETILLVEDEEAVRALTEKLLASRGYTVILAETPEEAIREGRQREIKIDLLLTDVVMPHMNGRELYHRMREIRPGIKVLFMSGYAADVIAKHGVLEEDTTFVAKPFTVDALVMKVREALEKEE
jgi:PAS domain S-box-containing protein